MPVYTSPDGSKVWFGKGVTICGLIAGVGLTALGSSMVAWTLSDLIERYKENYISVKEASRLFVEGGLSSYVSYVAFNAIPKKWKEWQRLCEFERQKGRRIERNDYRLLAVRWGPFMM